MPLARAPNTAVMVVIGDGTTYLTRLVVGLPRALRIRARWKALSAGAYTAPIAAAFEDGSTTTGDAAGKAYLVARPLKRLRGLGRPTVVAQRLAAAVVPL